jgi:hypothetical protein
MAGTIEIELARDIDREVLLEALEREGLTATAAENGRSIEIPCDGDPGHACDDLVHRVEALVAELDVPFVPERGDGRVFLRPPGS